MNEAELKMRARARLRLAEQQAAAQATQNQAVSEEEGEEPMPQTREEWIKYGMSKERRGRQLGGVADVGLSMATGGLASIGAGAASAVNTIWHGDGQKAADQYETMQDAGTYSPKTDAGKELMGQIGGVLQKAEPAVDATRRQVFRFSDLDSDEDGNPLVATALETAILGAPELLGAGRTIRGINARSKLPPPDLSAAAQDAKRLGIDLNNSTIRDSTVEAARRLTGDQGRATTGAESLGEGLREAAKASRKKVNAAFTLARSKDAYLHDEPILDFAQTLESDLIDRGADFAIGTKMADRINELREITTQRIGPPTGRNTRAVSPNVSERVPGRVEYGPNGEIAGLVDAVEATPAKVQVPLNELYILRQRLSKNIKQSAKAADGEFANLLEFKSRLDKFLDNQFLNDMVYGDQTAKAAWKDANKLSNEHKVMYRDDKIVRALVENEMTAKDTVKLILGASETNHKASAFRIVQNLKKILGPDSDKLQSLEAAVYADVFEPILKDPPSFNQGLERIRKLKKDELPLLKELNVSERDLDFMARAMRVARGVTTKELLMDKKQFASMVIARLGFGHDIAKAGVYTKTANMLLDKLLGVGQKTHEQLLKEFSEDLDAPVFDYNKPRVRDLYGHAVAISEMQNADEEPEER
jgi:hypothetical protein